ncbi:hypothetical protein CHS0354_001729 [Potamilus streckersoni]|uniref:Cell wall hydrolase SleB domain-containing protein n=1 Tax=Potamilus streckersoni TaxID=2493646 RepID=A0AAE0W4Z6_9BIVA|nr:hypothetical protein CHS0354_001729 [Potamilus streckersoni]
MSSWVLYLLVFLVTPVACNLCTWANMDLVSRIVFGEARYQNDNCKLAVAFTVVNRVNAAGFPNTVPEVLNQRFNNGQNHQFVTLDDQITDRTWVSAKAAFTVPYGRSVNAATFALCGAKSDPTSGATFFCTDPSCGPSFETEAIKVINVINIGNHYFFVMGPSA